MVIGRDVVVPVLNTKNPLMDEISINGMSIEVLNRIFGNVSAQHTANVTSNNPKMQMTVYVVNDESVKSAVSRFLKVSDISSLDIIFGNETEVISSIQNNPNAIGFCHLSGIFDSETSLLATNISLVPIDKNGNGHLDAMEDIYADMSVFMRGVWIGKYPKALINKMYAINNTLPAKEAEVTFLKWILADGQSVLHSAGYSALETNEIQSQLAKLNPVAVEMPPYSFIYSPSVIFLLVFAAILAFSIFLTAVVKGFRKDENSLVPDDEVFMNGFDEKSVKIPMGLYFDKTHTWAFMEKDGVVSVGLDDFLQHITGPITGIEMKFPGEKIKKGEVLFTIIQHGKHLHVYAPVSGTIKQSNEQLKSRAGFINESPFTEGWVYKIEPAGWLKEIQLLTLADSYKKWIRNEFIRVKDFLTDSINTQHLEYAHIVLQDGGLLKDNVLAEFGPEVWDDFQTKFLDLNK
jgi:glycine cleavage system H lipoate-binding protein